MVPNCLSKAHMRLPISLQRNSKAVDTPRWVLRREFGNEFQVIRRDVSENARRSNRSAEEAEVRTQCFEAGMRAACSVGHRSDT